MSDEQTPEEWYNAGNTDSAAIMDELVRAALAEGRRAGLEEAAAHCDKELKKIKDDPVLRASRELKIMGMTFGSASDAIRALIHKEDDHG